jgi:ribosome-associated translation inhibitor RaiA
MKIQFRDRAVNLSKGWRTHVEGRLGLALGRFGERIERVIVRMSDVAGESCCRIEVSVRARLIRAEGTAGDAFVAVDNAASRASSAVDRALERERLSVDIKS